MSKSSGNPRVARLLNCTDEDRPYVDIEVIRRFFGDHYFSYGNKLVYRYGVFHFDSKSTQHTLCSFRCYHEGNYHHITVFKNRKFWSGGFDEHTLSEESYSTLEKIVKYFQTHRESDETIDSGFIYRVVNGINDPSNITDPARSYKPESKCIYRW